MHAIASLVNALARHVGDQHPELQAIRDAAEQLDHTYVNRGPREWLHRMLRAMGRRPFPRTLLHGLLGELLLEELDVDGYPLRANLRGEFAALQKKLLPLRLPLIGAIRIAARLRAHGYQFIDGLFHGLIDESSSKQDDFVRDVDVST